jgi:ketopantoate reductase
MLLEALTGKETDIDDINGWIIDQAHQYGIPCDHHEGIRDLAKARTEEIKREMEAIEAVKRAGKQPSTR